MKLRLLILVTALAGCRQGPTSGDDSLGINYADWPSVTEKPYPVASAFIWMCATATPEQLKQRETAKREHGPHFESAIVVRVNPTGRDRFMSGLSVPVGTVVVKEKYPHSTDKPPVAVAVMIEREPGYDPEHGDWEYGYQQLLPEQEKKTVRGKLDSCIDCHQAAKDKDYLFRPYLHVSR